MKKINQYKFIAGVFAVSLLASCNYEEINTNPFELTDEEGIMDGVAVGGLNSLSCRNTGRRHGYHQSIPD